MSSMNNDSGLDFELNLAPIIDCLVVLITFTMISASFLSISVFDAGFAGPIDPNDKTPPPPVNITVELRAAGDFDVKVSGQIHMSKRIPMANGERDYLGLSNELKSLKARWPKVTGVSVEADDLVPYKNIVRAMDSAKESFPEVALGGT